MRRNLCLQVLESAWLSDVWYLRLLCSKVICLQDFFSTDAAVIENGYAYLKGFALETIVTAILFSMVGYFNGNNKTIWVMTQGLIQTLLVRLPLAYFYEYPAKRQPHKDWSGSTDFNYGGSCAEHWILCIS